MDTDDFFKPVELPVTDVLDLHTFLPKEVPDLLNSYFEACLEGGIRQVRIIHGKGSGVLKKRVYGILSRHPAVASYCQAPLGAGGWGAVVVTLKQPRHKTDGGC